MYAYSLSQRKESPMTPFDTFTSHYEEQRSMNALKSNAGKINQAWALLPYVATGLGVWVLDAPLVAVAIYHAGIVFLLVRHRATLPALHTGLHPGMLAGMSLLCLSVWPLLTLLWPLMRLPGMDLDGQISAWGFKGPWVMGFVLYSITIHPVLEECFWRGLLPHRPLSDALFAGFHVLVMVLFLSWPWVLLGFILLCTGAFFWRNVVQKTNSLLIPILTHALADLAIVLGVIQILKSQP